MGKKIIPETIVERCAECPNRHRDDDYLLTYCSREGRLLITEETFKADFAEAGSDEAFPPWCKLKEKKG